MSPRGDPGARPRGATGATTGAATGAAAGHPGTAMPVRLARRRIGAGAAAVQNLLCRRRPPLALRAGGVAMQVLLGPAPAPPAPGPAPGMAAAPPLWLELLLDQGPAAVGLDWGQARRIGGIPLEAATPEDGALLLEEALAGWLEDVEARAGIGLRLVRLATDPPPACTLRLALRVDLIARPPAPPQALSVPLALSEAAGGALALALARLQPAAPAGATRPPPVLLRAAAEIGTMRLALGELARLRVGDALVPGDEGAGDAGWTDDGRGARIVIEDQLWAPARRADAGAHPGTWVLEGAFRPRQPVFPQSDGRMAMSQNSILPPPDESHGAMPPADPAQGGADIAGHDGALPPGPPDPAPPHARPGEGQRGPEPAEPAGGPASLDQVELRLSFRLGHSLISLADLRRAAPGTILTLDRPDGALVEILANGQVIGTGEVIAVAGRRAVEIRTLFEAG